MKKQVCLGMSLLVDIFAMTACAGNSVNAQGTQEDTAAADRTEIPAQTQRVNH